MNEYRIEKDSLGEVRVPVRALYGAQTQRAIDNFPISGITFPRVFIRALGLIKSAAADVNAEMGFLDEKKGRAIQQAADEVSEGKWDEHFPIDIFQTGSGTSTNMNANEVIANRSTQILGGEIGSRLIHPNDHVNMGQSTNDVIPTAVHLSSSIQIEEVLLPALSHLQEILKRRQSEFDDVVKTGRTHLMDAMPIRLSQEISGWAYQIEQCTIRLKSCLPRLGELAIGGTAVGTGINAHPEFGRHVAAKVSERTGIPFVETVNHFGSQSNMDTVTELSGNLKTAASSIMKIANDLRWMNSGPITGLAEIKLPALQPGSSIMPGKINPVICEAVMMVCTQVMGSDVIITGANAQGNFQLNVMLPVIIHNLLQSITILGNAARALADKAIAGFTVNEERISELIEKNPILATALNPVIGYERTADIVKLAYTESRRIKEVAEEMTDLSKKEIERLLDPRLIADGGILK